MADITESKVKLDDGFEVLTKTYKSPPGTAKAHLVFIHGFSDHSNNYTDFHTYLSQQRGINIHAFDQRGWGRSVKSKSHRGLTGPTPRVLADISCILRPVIAQSKADGLPVFLMGHSMGGAETLVYSCVDPDGLNKDIRGAVAIAPLIALHPATRPSGITVSVGRVAGRILPRHQLVNKLDPSYLSRDESKNRQWVEDDLCHDTGTLEGLAGMLDRGAQLENNQLRLLEGRHQGGKTRVMVVHGSGDKINDVNASRVWVERSCEAEDKRFWELDGWYHNLHIEPEHEMFQEKLADWIMERSGSL